MNRMRRLVVMAAISAAASVPAQAQTLTRSLGTTTNYNAIQSTVFGNQMTGMRVSSRFETCAGNGCTSGGIAEASGLWQNFGGGLSGADLYFNNALYGTVRISSGANTFNSNYTFNWLASNDFRTLKFQGGVGYGNVLFDIPTEDCGRRGPSITCAGNTVPSSTGNEFDIAFTGDIDDFADDAGRGGVHYSNAVTYLGQPVQFDVYTMVEMTFPTTGFGPDSDETPFNFQMDTDLAVVPEPSTYALMAAGLAALGAVSRRRRNNAA